MTLETTLIRNLPTLFCLQADDIAISGNDGIVDARLPAWNTAGELTVPTIAVANNP